MATDNRTELPPKSAVPCWLLAGLCFGAMAAPIGGAWLNLCAGGAVAGLLWGLAVKSSNRSWLTSSRGNKTRIQLCRQSAFGCIPQGCGGTLLFFAVLGTTGNGSSDHAADALGRVVIVLFGFAPIWLGHGMTRRKSIVFDWEEHTIFEPPTLFSKKQTTTSWDLFDRLEVQDATITFTGAEQSYSVSMMDHADALHVAQLFSEKTEMPLVDKGVTTPS